MGEFDLQNEDFFVEPTIFNNILADNVHLIHSDQEGGAHLFQKGHLGSQSDRKGRGPYRRREENRRQWSSTAQTYGRRLRRQKVVGEIRRRRPVELEEQAGRRRTGFRRRSSAF